VLICPSDIPPNVATSDNGCSYRGNYGIGPAPFTVIQMPDSGNGFYRSPGVLSAQSFPDGLSHTAAYSERLRGTGGGDQIVPSRDFGEILVLPYCIGRDADYALKCCRIASKENFPADRKAGYTWFFGDFECTAYNHAQEPNGRIPDSIAVGTWLGIVTARSLHPRGVNCLMADGSLRFIQDSIQRHVWRGLGTRNGDELVD
jgi:prepilin-type processing-associated H-X9-DG protein